MAFLLGLIIGSFLNVVIYRLPRRLSLANPPSTCPQCRTRLRPVELIPVLSYLILQGRCSHCRSPIPWRYPLVELLTGMAFFLLWKGRPGAFIHEALFVSLLIMLAFIDLEHMVMPNSLTLGGMAGGILLTFFGWGVGPASSLAGAGLGLGLIAVIIWASRGGMGLGDAKLLGLIGAFLGPWGAVGALFWGSLAGGLAGVILLAGGRMKRQDPLPFGPFLALGAVVMLAAGPDLVRWFLG